MTDAVWLTPRDALLGVDRGTLPMVFPTIKTIEQLLPFSEVDAALEAIGRSRFAPSWPTLVITPTGVGMRLDSGE